MIVYVETMVMTDAGEKVADAAHRNLVVQVPDDWEGNALKTEAALVDAFDDVRERVLRQFAAVRGIDPSKLDTGGRGPVPPPPDQTGRRRRGR